MVRFSVYLDILYISLAIYIIIFFNEDEFMHLVWWIIYLMLLILFSSRKSMTYLKIMKSSIVMWTEIKEQVRT